MTPDFSKLRLLVQACEPAGVTLALGGSGLLLSLGLVNEARDCDLTTDATVEQATAALSAFTWSRRSNSDGIFATPYRLQVELGALDIDLIGQFAIRTPTGTCRLPTIVCGEWSSIPLGSPEVWLVAYRLMERHAKADLLAGYLARQGARPEIQARLLAEPLPDHVRTEIQAWRLT